MSDKITAKGNTNKDFAPHKAGQFLAQCVDTIDLGEKVEAFQDNPEKLVPKCVLVFRTGEKNDKGEPHDIGQEYTISMGDRANLRRILEAWRGQPYTEGQISDGVPLDKLTGNWAILTVAHKTSLKGRTYGFIQSVVGAGMIKERPGFEPYKRAEFWQERKDEYAKDAKAFRNMHNGPAGDVSDSGFPDDTDDGSSMPF